MLEYLPLERFITHPIRAMKREQSSSLQYYRHHLAAIFAIEEINKNPDILPNMTLGFHIHDSCSNERLAAANTLSVLTGVLKSVPNYRCSNKGMLMGFVGHLLSSLSNTIYELVGIYGFPQISYGAQDPMFNDRKRFPTFYRTVADEKAQYTATVQLLKAFNWTWVGIVGSKNGDFQRASEQLKNEIISSGACVEFIVLISEKEPRTFGYALKTIRQSTVNVTIVYSNMILFLHMFLFLLDASTYKGVWITSAALAVAPGNIDSFFPQQFNGSLILAFHSGAIPGLSDFLVKASPSALPDDIITAEVWFAIFQCQSQHNIIKTKAKTHKVCNPNDTLKEYESFGYDVNTFRLTYNMFTAINTMAWAIHNMCSEKLGAVGILDSYTSGIKAKIISQKVNNYLKKIHLKTTSGDEIFLDEHGGIPARFDILNFSIFPNRSSYNRIIGTLDMLKPHGEQLAINKEAVLWPPRFNEIPHSVCSQSCQPGYRKALIKGKQVCCFSCVRCSEGEISTMPDMENCIKCPEDQWSNEKRDKCIMRTIDFLSYDDALGAGLASFAILMAFYTAAILLVFLKHQNSPIVRANNQGLSYALLLSLLLCFLCSLLFIGRPRKITCLLRQVAFGIIFSISISSVLGKTITVVIAFSATRPGSQLKKWVGTKVPKCLMVICPLIEVAICTVWLLISPPYPGYDTQSHTSKMILLCNEGSAIAFYIMVGYIAALAFVSFFIAYLARKLPNTFNEAQHITFSMLVFCSVWITFIPAYESTKGKYLAAVEIFAILASSSALVGFIFIPKCYIILLKPEQNTRSGLLASKSK